MSNTYIVMVDLQLNPSDETAGWNKVPGMSMFYTHPSEVHIGVYIGVHEVYIFYTILSQIFFIYLETPTHRTLIATDYKVRNTVRINYCSLMVSEYQTT